MKLTRAKVMMLIIYTTVIAMTIFVGLKTSDHSMLDEGNSFYIDKSAFDPSFNVRKLTASEQGRQVYTYQFSQDDVAHLQTDTLTFFMNKITDNAYAIKLNNIILAEEGDMKRGNSMLKNNGHHFTFDRELIAPDNTLEIQTYGAYKSGTETDGVYLVESDVGMHVAQRTEYMGNNLLVSGIVFLIFTAFLMIILYFFNEERESGFIYGAFALIFMAIYFIDYLKVIHLNHDYLFYKKLFLISLHVGIWFLMIAMSKFLNIKRLKYLPGLSAIGFIIMSLLVDHFVLYKKIYSLWYLVLVFIFIMAAISSIRHLRKTRHAFVFFVTLLYVTLYAGLVLAIEYATSSLKLNSPLVYIVIVGAIPVLFAFEELTNKAAELANERKQKEREHLMSLTDNLTGVWNQRYIYNKLEEKVHQSTIAMIDIDDFKAINDTHSHLAGDRVLQAFVDLARQHVRKHDDICRYGGDEFVILLYDCPLDKAAETMHALQVANRKHTINYEGIDLAVTVSIGLYETELTDTVKTALAQADKQLYKAKHAGKNCIA